MLGCLCKEILRHICKIEKLEIRAVIKYFCKKSLPPKKFMKTSWKPLGRSFLLITQCTMKLDRACCGSLYIILYIGFQRGEYLTGFQFICSYKAACLIILMRLVSNTSVEIYGNATKMSDSMFTLSCIFVCFLPEAVFYNQFQLCSFYNYNYEINTYRVRVL